MRAWTALLLLAVAGCQSAPTRTSHETLAALPSGGYVTLPALADDLDLTYRGEAIGFIELSAPPDHIMFVPDSRRVLVNGKRFSMVDPCMQRGDQFVLTSGDADLVRRRLGELRSVRPEPERTPKPPPLVIRREPRATGMPARWRPNPGVPTRDWDHIVIHHQAASSGSASYIHRLHRQRGWDGLGYHFVIGNGSMTRDGQVELGYRWKKQLKGAHARARASDDNRWNLHSIGICLVGDFTSKEPSDQQMDALVKLVRALCAEYGIPADKVVPHKFVRETACPGANFPWREFKSRIR